MFTNNSELAACIALASILNSCLYVASDSQFLSIADCAYATLFFCWCVCVCCVDAHAHRLFANGLVHEVCTQFRIMLCRSVCVLVWQRDRHAPARNYDSRAGLLAQICQFLNIEAFIILYRVCWTL